MLELQVYLFFCRNLLLKNAYDDHESVSVLPSLPLTLISWVQPHIWAWVSLHCADGPSVGFSGFLGRKGQPLRFNSIGKLLSRV